MKTSLSLILALALFLAFTGSVLAEPPLAPPALPAPTKTKKTTKSKAKPKTAQAAKTPAKPKKTAAEDTAQDAAANATETQSEAPAATEAAPAKTKGTKTPAPAAKATTKTKDSGKVKDTGKSGSEDYEKFLEKYGAWDRLDKVYSSQGQESPEILLKRATLAMQTGAPQQALEILEASPQLDDKDLELQRLWLGGQAARAAGDPSKAVFWFSQAGTLLGPKEFASRIQAEPDMDVIWVDVWRRFFWLYSSNFSGTSEGQQAVLQNTLDQARSVWKNVSFWETASKALSGAPAPSGKSLRGDVTEVGPSDRALVARALAAACLGYGDEAKEDVGKISTDILREFWGGIVGYVLTGDDPAENAQPHPSFPKASVFWTSNIMPRSESSRSFWLLPSDSTPDWQELLQKKRSLKDAARRYLGSEGSNKTLADLPVFAQYRFALAAAQGKTDESRPLWEALDKKSLPLSLKLAGMLILDEPLENLMPEDPNAAGKQFFLLSELASAGGADPQRPFMAPFWIRLEGRMLDNAMSRTWPLDRLMVLAEWSDRFDAKPTAEMAKRIAFLFPESDSGIKATLQLAKSALDAQQFQLADFYLGNIDPARLPRDLKAQHLELKGDLAFALGNFDEAARYFGELIQTGVKLEDATLIKVAFIQQQHGQLVVAQRQLEKLWERHESMPESMQAEILYYLAEGEHAMGNIDKALDYYLTLAWKYPKENIWALTAMFRAALIYDSQGNYETAKNLLLTVIRNAETEHQREAAKNRLAEIEAKMGRTDEAKPNSKGGTMVYPF